MAMITTAQQIARLLINKHRRRRFLSFCTVGSFGVLVNITCLYVGREFLFKAVPWPQLGLNMSLAFAILCATIFNFLAND
jgi:putative flippase GtrA